MPGRSESERGARRVGAVALLMLLLLFVALQEEPPSRQPLPSPPLVQTPSPKTPYLNELARRHRDERLTLDVIYASPLLPADEAEAPVFRVVLAYQGGMPPELSLLARPGGVAQLRTSDGFMTDNLVWQEELRRDGRILGYLFSPAGERQVVVTSRTRWIELSLLGLTVRPIRFRWPVQPRSGG